MLIASLSLAIGLAIYDLTIRELDLAATASQSQFAIYAADTGVDCALYWDLNYTDTDGSAFGTSSDSSWPGGGSGLMCDGEDITDSNWVITAPSSPGDAATTTFSLQIEATANQTYCVAVEVGKYTNGSGVLFTNVISRGYNTTCPPAEPLISPRIERALQVKY